MQRASSTEYRNLDDPAFLAERARIRGLLERTPEASPDRAKLTAIYAGLTAEFDQRASSAWTGDHD